MRFRHFKNLKENDDLFAFAPPANAHQQIYEYGLTFLQELEANGTKALQIPEWKQAIDQASQNQDGDQLFNFVLQLTGAPFAKAYAIDSFIREYMGIEGLNDFGWMIEQGVFDEFYDAWKQFGHNKEEFKDPVFKSNIRDFFKTDVKEENNEMFSNKSRIWQYRFIDLLKDADLAQQDRDPDLALDLLDKADTLINDNYNVKDGGTMFFKLLKITNMLMTNYDSEEISRKIEMLISDFKHFNPNLNEATDDFFGSNEEYGLKARIGKRIDRAFGEIYEHGDNGLDYLDRVGQLYSRICDKYDYDLDAVIANEPVEVLRQLADELEEIASELEDGYGGYLQEADIAEPPEPERPRPTKTKTRPRVDYDPFQQQPDQPLANRPEEPQGKQTSEPKSFRKASAASTRRAASNVGITPAMSQMFNRMQNIQLDPDLEPYEPEDPETLPSTQVNTENLPAVAGQALLAAGVQDPEFHRLSSLPGNMSGMVRQLSRLLFGSLTSTPANNIYTVANLGGYGPNTTQEVNAVASWVVKNGEDLGEVHVDFSNIMPGYTPEQRQYSAAGIRWLIAKDFAGTYIYCWPEADSKDAPEQQLRLGEQLRRICKTMV